MSRLCQFGLACAAVLSTVSPHIDARRIANKEQLGNAHQQATLGSQKLAVDTHEVRPASGDQPSSILQESQKIAAHSKGDFFWYDFLNTPYATGSFLGGCLLVWVMLAYCFLNWMNRPSKTWDEKRTQDYRWQPSAKVVRQQHIVDGQVAYEWAQTPDLATIYISMPGNVSKRELDIKISSKQIRVGRRGSPPLIQGEFYEAVEKESSRWALHSKGNLEIYLRKATPAEWPAALHFRKKSLDTSGRLPEIAEDEQQAED